MKKRYKVIIALVMLMLFVLPSANVYAAIEGGMTKDITTPLITTSPTDIVSYPAERNFRFVPAISGEYTIKTTGVVDTVGTLYDESGMQLCDNDDFLDQNFSMTWNLTAGQTYYIGIYNWDIDGLQSTLVITGGGLLSTQVNSISRQTPASATTNATEVTYRVIFSEPVTGVDTTDFGLTTSGTAGTIATVTEVSGTTYDVLIQSITGDGTMRLDLNNSGTGIKNTANMDISGGYTGGESYTFDHTSPTATIVAGTTAGGDALVSAAEKAAGFNVVAISSEATGTLYVVPSGTGNTIGAITGAAIGSAASAGAATNTTIAILPNNIGVTNGTEYKVYAVDVAGNISAISGVAFTAALAAEEFSIGEGINNKDIYANGNTIIIDKVSDAFPLLSNIYLDNGVIGMYEPGTDTIVDLSLLGLSAPSASNGGYDLSTYNIYGGKGTVAALVGNTQITMLGGKVQNLMGGGKFYPVTGDTYVTMRGGQATKVYGGSSYTNVIGNTNVTISGGTVDTEVHGGSEDGDVTGNTNVTIGGGTLKYVYGGTDSANDPATTQSTNIIISGGTFTSVYGGGKYSGGTNVNGNTNITINGGTFSGIIHGGTWVGDIAGSTNVNINGGTFANTIYGGSRSNDITGGTNVNISGGTLIGVNGGCSIGGTITGSRNIRISGGSITDTVTGNTAGKLTKADGTTPVYKTTLTLPGISAVTDVSGGSLTLGGSAASGYGLTGVKTTDVGLLTFYLPTGAATAAYAPNSYAVTVVNNDSNAFATASSNADLTTVAALTDATPGAQSGADAGNAIAWELDVANAKSTLALGDIAVAANATFKLYSNAAFTTEITGADTLPLAVGNTVAYIKVTAQDTTTVKYYTVTITRAADTTAPLVTSVSVPSNATYTAGQNLDFTVNFSENVTVSGTPRLIIDIGGSSVNAAYISGSGTSALVFRYTIVNENDSDGIAVNSPLDANGSTIKDVALNDLTNWALVGVGSTTNVLVDARPPILSATSSSGETATSAGINFTSDEAGTYYYLVYAATDAVPSSATVRAQGAAVKKGTAAALAAANSVSINGLTASTAYKAYVIVEDVVLNKSEVSTIAFTTAVAPVQATPTFSPGAGEIAYGSTVTISSAGADAIYYTTDGTDPTTASTNQAATPLVINSAVTVKAIAVKAGMTNSAIGSAAYTQAVATAPSAIALAGGGANPVGGVTNVVIPAAGATDTTGAITGWVTGTNDKIKLTVTDAGGTSAITVNGAAYTSGADYTIASVGDLTIVVTTTEAGKVTGVRTFTVSVAAAPVQATPTFSPGAGAIAYGSTVTISSAGADAIYYTTDGTDPTTASTNQATTPLVINAPVIVKAIAVKAGMTNSAIGSAAYTQAASANLTGLVLSGTPGNYTFAGGTYTYDGVTVANGVASITVTPTGAGTITVDGTPVATTVASGAIPLDAGVEKTITVVATETGKTAKTYTIKVTRAVPPTTYTMTVITDQTLTAVTAGYGAGTQETKTLTITRTGTGDLASVATALSGANAGSFTITQPAVTTLNNGTPNTTFTVKANDGLAVGTYTATVTVSATNMTNVTFTVTQVVNSSSGGGDSGEGSSGGGGNQLPALIAPILTDIMTQDEQKLEISLQKTGEAKIDLVSTGTGQANITGNVLNQLSELSKPLTVTGQGVSLQFDPDSLQTTQVVGQSNTTVQIGAAAVTSQEQLDILAAAPLGESTGIFQVGGQVFNFTAQVSTTTGGATNTENVSTFSQPVAVTIDLSGLVLTDEQISGLSGARLEKDADGNVVPVFLGGSYDPVTKTITFYTDRFSIYTVLQKNGLVVLNLTIGNTITKLNGQDKAIDVPPTLINNRTFVPLRFIGEALGATFDWNDKTKTVTFQSGSQRLALTVGSTIPGMDTQPTIVSGRTMVPLRYISETFGAQVMWFPASRSVSVVK